MSTEENKARVRRIYEEINSQNHEEMMEEFAARDLVWHGAPPGTPPGLAGAKQAHTTFFTGFPDLHATVEDLIAEGDKVVARVTSRATHQGEFMGIPPTGKRLSWTWIEIDRIKDGKIVECWDNSDDLGLLQQLGAIPQMAQAGA